MEEIVAKADENGRHFRKRKARRRRTIPDGYQSAPTYNQNESEPRSEIKEDVHIQIRVGLS
jgi:hypothetical protein